MKLFFMVSGDFFLNVIRSHMNMGDLYVFDRFETAATALRSKICTEIFVLGLQPTVMQRSSPIDRARHCFAIHNH